MRCGGPLPVRARPRAHGGRGDPGRAPMRAPAHRGSAPGASLRAGGGTPVVRERGALHFLTRLWRRPQRAFVALFRRYFARAPAWLVLTPTAGARASRARSCCRAAASRTASSSSPPTGAARTGSGTCSRRRGGGSPAPVGCATSGPR
jgi:hypothetical protein